MLGPILAVTAVTHNLGAVQAAYGSALGYELVANETVHPALAGLWNAPRAAGRPMLTLAPRTGEKVLLRFVEMPHLRSVPSNSTLGWNVMELNVGELDSLAETLRRSPFIPVGAPAALPNNPYIRAMQVRGPDEELVYLTEVMPSEQTRNLPQTKSGVGPLFIIVLGVADFAASKAFYGGKLAQTLTDPRAHPLPQAAGPLGLPLDHPFVTALARLPGKFLIEIDEFGNTARSRPHDDGDISGGIISVSFAVSKLDDSPIAFAAPPAVMSGAPYNNARAAAILGPDGERLELIERSFS
jgi:catechol 2,3-dioxygenase-like lactoylglutathione lyase family enzyme